jgi:hypothetical protein
LDFLLLESSFHSSPERYSIKLLIINCFKQERITGAFPWKAVANANYRISIRHVKGKTIQKIYFRRSEKGFSPPAEKNISLHL